MAQRRPRSEYSRDTRRILRVIEKNLARADDSKGAVLVRALLAGMTDEGVFLHLVDRDHVPSYATIRFYRMGLRMLGHDVRSDAQLRRTT